MKYTSEEIVKLQPVPEASIKKASQLKQVLAQIEASLSRKENQKVFEKSQDS